VIAPSLPRSLAHTFPNFPDLSRKSKRGFVSRIASFHGAIAWMLFLSTLLYAVKTRSSMSKELAELRQFSSSSEAETFDKMSKLNQQISQKNKEIGDLNKAMRAKDKSLESLETEKAAEQANLQIAKDETSRCMQRESSLNRQLSDCNAHCAKELDSHDESHRSKDAEIEGLRLKVEQLIAQTQQQQQQQQQEPSPVPMNNNKQNNNQAKKGNKAQQQQQQQQQQQVPTPPGKVENVRYEESEQQDDPVANNNENIVVTPLPTPPNSNPKRRKKKPSKLEQDIGVTEDEQYDY